MGRTYPNDLFHRVKTMHGARNKYSIVQIICRTIKYGTAYLTYQGVKPRNKLTPHFKCLPSVEDFNVLWLFLSVAHVYLLTVLCVVMQT